MFEIKHLKTLTALAETGNIRKAADVLFTSQSALSHQIKDLEQRLNTSLFIRNTSPVKFTPQGQVLLALSTDILPRIEHALSSLKDESNVTPQLNLAIACHACFQWLLPVINHFSLRQPEVKIELLEQVFPKQNEGKSTVEVDILFTDEKKDDDYIYQPLGAFEVVAVLAKQNENKGSSLADRTYLSAEDFNPQVLLTYPVKTEELDVFKLFLNEETNKTINRKKPITIKQIANSHMILQMVAANMGIATLPDWLVNSLAKRSLIQTKQIGETGIHKTLYARYQAGHPLSDTIEKLIPQTVAAFNNLYHTESTT